MTCPWWRTVMRWAMANTTSISCSVKSRVRPRSRPMRSMSWIDSRVSWADMPAVGSSRRRMAGSRASSICFWLPWDRKPATSPALSRRPTAARRASVSSRYSRRTGVKRFQPRPRWERKAAWMFSYTVSLGKMFVRWKERPMPRRQRSCGAIPVTSRSLKRTLPASGRRCPVIRLKSVVLPAPLGPMMALIEPRGTLKLTPPTAWKPAKLLRRPWTSSTGDSRAGAPQEQGRRAGDAPREYEEEHHENGPEHERPVLRVGHDLLVEPDERGRAHRGTPEGAHAAEQRHDQDLGGLGPVGEVGEDAAVEDAEKPSGQPREGAREHEGGQLVAVHVDADELRPLGILADGGEHAPEGRPHDTPEDQEARGDQDQGHEVELLGGAVAAQHRHEGREAVDPAEVRIRDLRHALLASRHLVPFEAHRPHDLGKGESEHGEVDAGETHAEEAEDEGEQGGEETPGREGEEEGHPGLLHEDARGVGADPEVCGMSEGDEPGVAHEEIEAGGEERPDEDVVGEKRVVARAQGGDEERGHEHEGDPRHPADAHRNGRPRRPQGRMISTAAMRAKIEKMAKRGKKRMPKERTWP